MLTSDVRQGMARVPSPSPASNHGRVEADEADARRELDAVTGSSLSRGLNRTATGCWCRSGKSHEQVESMKRRKELTAREILTALLSVTVRTGNRVKDAG